MDKSQRIIQKTHRKLNNFYITINFVWGGMEDVFGRQVKNVCTST